MSTCSQGRPDRGHEQVEEGCRSTRLKCTSSNVRWAGALVPPPSCLGGRLHGGVQVYTHSTPVLTSVRRLWVAQTTPRAQRSAKESSSNASMRTEPNNTQMSCVRHVCFFMCSSFVMFVICVLMIFFLSCCSVFLSFLLFSFYSCFSSCSIFFVWYDRHMSDHRSSCTHSLACETVCQPLHPDRDTDHL